MHSSENLVYLLFALLLLFTSLNFLLFNFDYLQPTVIFNSVMTVSLFFAVLNVKRWNLYVGEDTTVVVMMGMLAFSLGALFCYSVVFIVGSKHIVYNKIDDINVSASFLIGLFLLMFGLLVFSINEMYNISLQVGNTGGYANMIRAVRYPLERGEISFSRWMNYRYSIAYSIACVSMFAFINNTLNNAKFVFCELKYMLLVIGFIPFSVLTTGRRDLIHFLLYSVVIFCVLYFKKHRYNFKNKVKGLVLISGTVASSILAFFLMGHLTGKVASGLRTPYIILSHYLGLSVPALDKFLNTTQPENVYIGQNTLIGIYGNLNSLGFNLEKGKSFLPFVEFDGINTNVYTVMARQIADYGFLGMLLIMAITGILITWFYEYVKTCNVKPIILITYGMFSYIPFFLFIDDQFMTVLSTSTIYKIIMAYVVLKFFTYNSSTLGKKDLKI